LASSARSPSATLQQSTAEQDQHADHEPDDPNRDRRLAGETGRTPRQAVTDLAHHLR
jgi:hypothetical protein